MAENDEHRIEGRLGPVSGGGNATFDKIQEMQARVAQHERESRPKPSKAFGELLRKEKLRGDEEPALSEKEINYRGLPKKGPRPNAVSPSFQQRLGQGAKAKKLILKG